MPHLRTIASYAVFPALLIGPLALSLWGHARGIKTVPLIAGCMVVALAVELALERIMPYRPVWRDRRRIWSDLAFMGMGALTSQLVDIAVLAGVVVLAIELADAVGASLWPHSWPLWAQFGLGVAIADFTHYWAHRTLHSVPWLWRFHQVHHRPDHLYSLNFFRMHPVDIAFKTTANLAPLVLLGAPEPVILLWSVASGINAGSLNHANVESRTGWLDGIFSTPTLHRWHHSRNPEEYQSNYSNITIVYDRLFGSYHNPRATSPDEIGQPGGSYSLGRELVLPFRHIEP